MPLKGIVPQIRCIDCKYHRGDGIWYNHYCHHHAVSKGAVDPVYGTERRSPPHCREINKNLDCEYFDAYPPAPTVTVKE